VENAGTEPIKMPMQNNIKFFLTNIFVLVACLSLHAKEQAEQPEIFTNDSSLVYISENAQIYGKEHLLKQNTPHVYAKNATGTESKTNEPSKKNLDNKEPEVVVFPDFPFDPSSSSSLNMDYGSPATVFQQKRCGHHSVCRAYNKNAFQSNENIYFAVCLPVQRQRLSTAAIQCGTLTSFSAQSPPEDVPSGTRYW